MRKVIEWLCALLMAGVVWGMGGLTAQAEPPGCGSCVEKVPDSGYVGDEISGLCYEEDAGVLYSVDDADDDYGLTRYTRDGSGDWAVSWYRNIVYSIGGTKRYFDLEGCTIADPGSGKVYVSFERYGNSVGSWSVSKSGVLQVTYTTSGSNGDELYADKLWLISNTDGCESGSEPFCPGDCNNDGAEGVTFIPAADLQAVDLWDDIQSDEYDLSDYSGHVEDGVFALACQNDGYIYLFNLNTDGSWNHIADSVKASPALTTKLNDLVYDTRYKKMFGEVDTDRPTIISYQYEVVDSKVRLKEQANLGYNSSTYDNQWEAVTLIPDEDCNWGGARHWVFGTEAATSGNTIYEQDCCQDDASFWCVYPGLARDPGCHGCPADFDDNGVVNVLDFSYIYYYFNDTSCLDDLDEDASLQDLNVDGDAGGAVSTGDFALWVNCYLCTGDCEDIWGGTKECISDEWICEDPKPACNTSTNYCVECTSNGHCESPDPVCKTTSGIGQYQCGDCLSNPDCEGEEICVCSPNGCHCEEGGSR